MPKIILAFAYVRCVWRNVFLRTAYAMTVVGVILLFFHTPLLFALGMTLLLIGGFVLIMMLFGLVSIGAYMKTWNHYAQHDYIDTRAARLLSDTYCSSVGYYIAAKDIIFLLKTNPFVKPSQEDS